MLPLSVFQQGFPRGEQPRTYLPSLPSAALPELSSLAAPPSWLCRLRFPSAPRFLPWHHRGADCGLPADKTKPLFPSLLKINNNKKKHNSPQRRGVPSPRGQRLATWRRRRPPHEAAALRGKRGREARRKGVKGDGRGGPPGSPMAPTWRSRRREGSAAGQPWRGAAGSAAGPASHLPPPQRRARLPAGPSTAAPRGDTRACGGLKRGKMRPPGRRRASPRTKRAPRWLMEEREASRRSRLRPRPPRRHGWARPGACWRESQARPPAAPWLRHLPLSAKTPPKKGEKGKGEAGRDLKVRAWRQQDGSLIQEEEKGI